MIEHPCLYEILKRLNNENQTFEQLSNFLDNSFPDTSIRRQLGLAENRGLIIFELDFNLKLGRPHKIYSITEKGRKIL